MRNHIVVVGGGSIGSRHVRNLHSLGQRDIVVVEPNNDRRVTIARDYEVAVYATLDAAMEGAPRAVLVCTPPYRHVEVARAALEAGAHLFIEKPLSHTLDSVEALLAAAADKGRIILVGYNLRYHPGLIKVESLIRS